MQIKCREKERKKNRKRKKIIQDDWYRKREGRKENIKELL